MIYYPSEAVDPTAWASQTLQLLGYDADPAKLQLLIRTVFEAIARSGIHIQGTEIVPFPLFDVLDPTDPADYVARVEPSVVGGRKMAEALFTALAP